MAGSLNWRGLSLLCVLLATCTLVAAQGADVAQARSMLLLRASIDRGDVLTDWTGEDYCSWGGVTCNANGQVEDIDISGKGLDGQLPIDEVVWGGLSSVKNINLSGNQLSGFLPPQMSALKNAESISLNENQFESPLPETWGSLSKLRTLNLGSNALFGDLPASWGSLSSLETLDLSNNDLSGEVPPSWSDLPAEGVNLEGNTQVAPPPAVLPPAVVPAPVPAPVVVPAPVPAPVVVPAPVPAPAPVPVVPAPAPAKIPTTSADFALSLSGLTPEQFDAEEQAAYKEVIAKVTGQPAEFITVSGSAPTAARKLLQEASLVVVNQVATNKPAEVTSAMAKAEANGSLARELKAAGFTLVPGSLTSDVTVAPVAPPTEDDGDDDDDNTGAIVGGVIGGVVGLGLIAGAGVYASKKRKAGSTYSQPATGTKKGDVMFSSNPAFDGAEAAPAVAPSASRKKPPVPPIDTAKAGSRKDNPMFGGIETPRTGGRGSARGDNPLYETGNSQLSNPDNAVYATAQGGSALGTLTSSADRLESARSGLRANPVFADAEAGAPGVLDSDENDFKDANPLFQSARSGTDIMESAQSDLLDSQFDSRYDTETASAAVGPVPVNPSAAVNPLFGAESQQAKDGENPLFQEKTDLTKSPRSRKK